MNIFDKMKLLKLIRDFKNEKVGKPDCPRFCFFDERVSLVEKWVSDDIRKWLNKDE